MQRQWRWRVRCTTPWPLVAHCYPECASLDTAGPDVVAHDLVGLSELKGSC